MKIMYVDQTGQLGGGELSLLDLIRCSPRSSEITLFSNGPFREALEQLGVPVHLISDDSLAAVRRKPSIATMLGAGPALMRQKKRLAHLAARFDVLYANSQKAFIVSSLAKRRGQLLVWHLRDMLTAEHFSPILRKIAVTAGNSAASVVIANSQATAESFVQSGGDRNKVAVVYNGINSAPFDAVSGRVVHDTLQKLGLENRFLVGVFGRISPWKGQHVLLEAVAMLPDIHVAIVGEALFGEDAYMEKLQHRARHPDLAGRVHFLGFRRDIPALMKCMNAVVHTSISPEPFGRVIVEAMLAERPIIVTRAGGALEIIEDNYTGLFVSPGSAAELAAAITKLRDNPQFSTELAAAGRASAMNRFSVNTMVEEIQHILNRLRAA